MARKSEIIATRKKGKDLPLSAHVRTTDLVQRRWFVHAPRNLPGPVPGGEKTLRDWTLGFWRVFGTLPRVKDNSKESFRALLATPEPPELGPGPRDGIRTQAELDRELRELFAPSPLPTQSRELVRALVLLWHDHLDASHTISQGIENPDGSLLHAIMHRREPDYWNSKYWWRRVGNHPVFPEIARRVELRLIQGGPPEQLPSAPDAVRKLLRPGRWNPDGFVDACAAVAGEPTDAPSVRWLREVQRAESEAVLEYLLDLGRA